MRALSILPIAALSLTIAGCACDADTDDPGDSNDSTSNSASGRTSRDDGVILLEAWRCEAETDRCVALADDNELTPGQTLQVTAQAVPGLGPESELHLTFREVPPEDPYGYDSLIVEEFVLGAGDTRATLGFDAAGWVDGVHAIQVTARVITENTTFSYARQEAIYEVVVNNCPDDALDTSVDGVDQDCDHVDGPDADRDRLAPREAGGVDCDDADPLIGRCGLEPGEPDLADLDLLATRLTRIEVATQTGAPEPALAPLVDLLVPEWESVFGDLFDVLFRYIDVDMNGTIAERLDQGDINLGLLWEPADAPSHFNLRGVQLTPTAPLAEPAEFAARRDGYPTGSRTPWSNMPVEARDGEFRSVEPGLLKLPFPFGDALLLVDVSNAVIQGRYEETDAGIRITEAVILGTVFVDAIFAALDAYINASCGCLNAQRLYTDACQALPSSTCGDGTICETLGGACSLLKPIFTGHLHLDLIGDPFEDAMGVQLAIGGEPIHVSGFAGEPSP